MKVESKGEPAMLLVGPDEEGWKYLCRVCNNLGVLTIGGKLTRIKPTHCGRCGSTNIDIDDIRSRRLEDIRFGPISWPDRPIPEKKQG